MNKKIAIIGAGGHGKVVGEIALLNRYKTINFFDDRADGIKGFPFTVIGTLDNLKKHLKDYDDFFVAIGDNELRYEKIMWLKTKKVNLINLIHPSSVTSQFSTFRDGICVAANAVINPGTEIKDGVIINTSASIDHDCKIGSYVHISPNCSVSGGVNIGEFTHLGSGTSVHPDVTIGCHVKTGVGSKIFKDIKDNQIYIS